MGRSTESGPVHHPSSLSSSCSAAPRCPPFPAGNAGPDGSARPGDVVLLFYPLQERTDSLLPQPCSLLFGIHVLFIHDRGLSWRKYQPGAGVRGNCRGHAHSGSASTHQARPWCCAAKPEACAVYGEV